MPQHIDSAVTYHGTRRPTTACDHAHQRDHIHHVTRGRKTLPSLYKCLFQCMQEKKKEGSLVCEITWVTSPVANMGRECNRATEMTTCTSSPAHSLHPHQPILCCKFARNLGSTRWMWRRCLSWRTENKQGEQFRWGSSKYKIMKDLVSCI